VPCPANHGSVDLRDSRYPDDVLHASAAEWAEFLARAKRGTYDEPGRADGHAADNRSGVQSRDELPQFPVAATANDRPVPDDLR
jgi:hypothetical protein